METAVAEALTVLATFQIISPIFRRLCILWNAFREEFHIFGPPIHGSIRSKNVCVCVLFRIKKQFGEGLASAWSMSLPGKKIKRTRKKEHIFT